MLSLLILVNRWSLSSQGLAAQASMTFTFRVNFKSKPPCSRGATICLLQQEVLSYLWATSFTYALVDLILVPCPRSAGERLQPKRAQGCHRSPGLCCNSSRYSKLEADDVFDNEVGPTGADSELDISKGFLRCNGINFLVLIMSFTTTG